MSYCQTGKTPYLNRSKASAALRRIQARGRGKRPECRVYLCPDCGFWHLSSSRTDVKR